MLAPNRRRGCCWPAAQPRASSPLPAGQHLQANNRTEKLLSSSSISSRPSSTHRRCCRQRRRVAVSCFHVVVGFSSAIANCFSASPRSVLVFLRKGSRFGKTDRQTELASLYHPNSTHHPHWRVGCNVGSCPGGQKNTGPASRRKQSPDGPVFCWALILGVTQTKYTPSRPKGTAVCILGQSVCLHYCISFDKISGNEFAVQFRMSDCNTSFTIAIFLHVTDIFGISMYHRSKTTDPGRFESKLSPQ